jgi:superfamily II DNA/RNA helicase
MLFSDLGLSEELLRAVNDAGYTEPTPIQQEGIPQILQGNDILGVAQTGTGKTASFTLPMIDLLAAGRARARMARTLILEPTRELAAQVADNFEVYGKYHKLTMALLIGGVSFGDQEKKLDRGVDVLIATPGRLLDHFGRGKLMLTGVQVLVIDEADRMLDMGFIPDVEKICTLISKKRQTLLFSATMPKEIQRLANSFLTDPVRVEVAPPASPAENVEQRIVYLSPREKDKTLRTIIDAAEVQNAIIFCNRKRDVDSLHKLLKKGGLNVAALHGDMAQSSRMEVLATFKAGDVPILIASDVAARGLDITLVSHVFNYDVPTHAEDYIHRIGRTGRAGRSGHAVTLSTPAEQKYVDAIVKMIGRDIPTIDVPGVGRPAPTEDKKAAPRSRSRAPKQAKADPKPKEEAAPVEKKAAPSPSPEKPAPKPEKPAAKKKAAAPQKPSGPVLGLGDHMPAFLAREPKIRK